jgi:hypothetical protein
MSRQPPSDVARQSIRFFPTSNTEVNTDRLPDPKATKNMELCYREEAPVRPAEELQLLVWLILLVVSASLFASFCLAVPGLAIELWRWMEGTEGLPVVGSLLLGMAALVGLLSLVFVPEQIRRGLLWLSLPGVINSFLVWRRHDLLAAASLLLVSLFAVAFWRRSVTHFHEQWLFADPRMDKIKRFDWRGSRKGGWSIPSLGDIATVLRRYLTYEAPASGAAGVWIAPSSRSVRVFAAALLGGNVVALAARLVTGVVAVCVTSFVALLLAVAFVIGETTRMSGRFGTVFGSDSRSVWQRHVDRLSNSEHVAIDVITGASIRESEHLFLGIEPWQNFPVLLHRPALYEHAYIIGRTGAGKTSMGLMQILIQCVRGHFVPDKNEWSEKTPVIIIDLKGDEVLFQTAKSEAEERGQKFRFFTLEPGKATFHFNPFSGFGLANRTIPQLVHLVLDALSLYHGAGYGKGYYSQRSRFFLSKALESAGAVNSFPELYKKLQDLYGNEKQDFRDAFELLSVIESLTHYEQLVTTQSQDEDSEADIIRMDRVLEDREVVYFWLPSVKESAAVSEVGKLVLFNLQTAAQDRQDKRNERRQAFLVIDECQKLAGENFQQILQQARSAGVAAVLANQSLSDLKTEDWDLRPAIRTNTRVKMFFSINEPEDLQAIVDFCGEEIQVYGADDSEAIRPRLSAKELLALSDHPKRLLLHVSSGSGYTQFGGLPIPVETDWPISKSIADERASLPWPSSPMPIKAAVKSPKPPAPPAPAVRSSKPKPKPSPKPMAAKAKQPVPALKAECEREIQGLFD